MVISPFSVAAVLTMAHNGAKHNTATQINNGINCEKFLDREFLTRIGKLLYSNVGLLNYIAKQDCSVIFLINISLACSYLRIAMTLKLPNRYKMTLNLFFKIEIQITVEAFKIKKGYYQKR